MSPLLNPAFPYDQLGEVPMDKTIKELVGGKSTLQNEILGDLSAELATSSMPERVEEMALADVADKLKGDGKGRLGKHFSQKVCVYIYIHLDNCNG